MASGASPHPALPRSTDELTPQWFSTVLSARDEDVVVETAEIERLGGLSSVVVRARLAYAPGTTRGPASVIVKLPLARAPKRFGPGYDREVRFYRELAPRMNVAVPRALWIDVDDAAGDSVLVLEDFATYEARSEDDFATPEQVQMLLAEIARVHAAWWGSEELGRHPFLRTLPEFIGRVESQLPGGVPLLLDRFGSRMDAEEMAVFEALPRGFRTAAEPLAAAPKTLVHHDLSLRNVLLGQEGSQPAVVLIDWQLAQWNAGVRDVSFLVGNCVPAERRTHEERRLLRDYWERLRDGGVGAYSFEQLEEDYRRSVVAIQPHGDDADRRRNAGLEAAVAHQLACRRGSARELDRLSLLKSNPGPAGSGHAPESATDWPT
jgi:aminoglycoside phosphotransferase (APT) family kinase protein